MPIGMPTSAGSLRWGHAFGAFEMGPWLAGMEWRVGVGKPDELVAKWEDTSVAWLAGGGGVAQRPARDVSWSVLSAASRLGIGVVCCWMGTW